LLLLKKRNENTSEHHWQTPLAKQRHQSKDIKAKTSKQRHQSKDIKAKTSKQKQHQPTIQT
jgi:hypothetical protein